MLIYKIVGLLLVLVGNPCCSFVVSVGLDAFVIEGFFLSGFGVLL